MSLIHCSGFRSHLKRIRRSVGNSCFVRTESLRLVDADGESACAQATICPGVLSEVAIIVPCWHRRAVQRRIYWSRKLQALGHTVRLVPPADVTPYVKRQKNDAADAEVICEAVTRPNMPLRRPRCQSSSALEPSFASTRLSSILSERTLRSSRSSHLSGAGVSSNCSKSSPMSTTLGSSK
jgi:hypothetical protein